MKNKFAKGWKYYRLLKLNLWITGGIIHQI